MLGSTSWESGSAWPRGNRRQGSKSCSTYTAATASCAPAAKRQGQEPVRSSEHVQPVQVGHPRGGSGKVESKCSGGGSGKGKGDCEACNARALACPVTSRMQTLLASGVVAPPVSGSVYYLLEQPIMVLTNHTKHGKQHACFPEKLDLQRPIRQRQARGEPPHTCSPFAHKNTDGWRKRPATSAESRRRRPAA
jgi:hypothetical protein